MPPSTTPQNSQPSAAAAAAVGGPMQLHPSSSIPHGHVPAYLPGSASLVEELDQGVMIVLRDGRHLLGTLCSFDQFSNLVLQNTVERRILVVPISLQQQQQQQQTPAYYYTDIPLGLYCVRGENTVIMGRHNPHAMGIGQPLDLPTFQTKTQELKQSTSQDSSSPVQWDFDADLTA